MPRKSTTSTSGGERTAPDVTTFLERLDHPMKAAIVALRAVILGVDGRISEGIKWNAPSFATTEHFATFHLRGRTGVQVVMHLGAKARPDVRMREAVPDPHGLLEWKDANRAVVTFADADDVAARRAAFAAIVREWIRHV